MPIETDWLKIKEAITKAAEESVGYKKRKNWKWLRTWNDEIQLAIEEKKASYRKYLQTKTVEQYTEYKKTPGNSKENDKKPTKRGLGQIC